jgi:hypothetical protein
MNERMRSLLLITLLPGFASCGAAQYGATPPPAPAGGSGLTFAWHQAGDRVLGDARLEGNSFFEECLHEAVAWELSMRGIRYDESSPTLLVHHHLRLADHELVSEMVDEAGNRITEVYTYDEGGVVVHIHYPDDRNFWIGWANADIAPAIVGPEGMRKWVYKMVHDMFKTWPIPERRNLR